MTARLLWRRVQETPLELTTMLVAVVIAVCNLAGRYETLTVFAIVFYAVLLAGGIAGIWGRFKDNLSAESVGLALMVGGFTFSSLRSLARSEDAVDTTRALLVLGAISTGLLIRLSVVRKAMHAREAARGVT